MNVKVTWRLLFQMTQQDLSFVAQFLKENFTKEMESSGFKLEKVGQVRNAVSIMIVRVTVEV